LLVLLVAVSSAEGDCAGSSDLKKYPDKALDGSQCRGLTPELRVRVYSC
jgi:hypothetical protein